MNADIIKTCSDTQVSHQFWFLNNGITIICDRFDAVTDPDNPHVKLENMQIVNGCQTATTLANAYKSGALAADTRVLLRIYETADAKLVDKIVLTTNNQNKITSRDLRSNDQEQVDMQAGFEKYSLSYERKINQYGPSVPSNRIAVNEIVAQSYLAVVLKKPSDARRRKYKVWGDLYEKIFAGQAVEPHVIALLVYRIAGQWLVKQRLVSSKKDLERKLANNGAFHIARIAAFLWRGSDSWTLPVADLQKQIAILEKTPNKLHLHLKKAFAVFRELVENNAHYAADIDTALKSGTLDTDIDKRLHKSSK